uniref:DUF4220 domain-containing protein n=1 Tax=Aegilops tauschii subsp. strangulata TaxID=200361 RepID=A0A453H9B3_AEGTS
MNADPIWCHRRTIVALLHTTMQFFFPRDHIRPATRGLAIMILNCSIFFSFLIKGALLIRNVTLGR